MTSIKKTNSKKQRNLEIIELYVEKNKSYEEIGEIFGVSRQRIQQILKKCVGSNNLKKVARKNRIKRVKRKIDNLPEKKCLLCSKKFKSRKNSKYCHKNCYLEHLDILKNDPVLIKERKKLAIERVIKWQRNNKDKVAEYNKKTWAKIIANDPNKRKEYAKRGRLRNIKKFGSVEAYKKHCSEKTKEFYRRLKSDTKKYKAFKEKHKLYKQKSIEKLKREDPVKYEEMKQKAKEKAKIKYQEKKALKVKVEKIKEKKSSIYFN